MSTLSQFTGVGVTTAIVNFHSSGGTATSSDISPSASNGAREILSGAVTANTLATLLSITGRGRVPLLTAYTKDATSRTVRLVVEVDGVTAFDATSSAITTPTCGIFAAGNRGASTGVLSQGDPIVFARTLVVKVASSLTETDKVAIGYIVNRT